MKYQYLLIIGSILLWLREAQTQSYSLITLTDTNYTLLRVVAMHSTSGLGTSPGIKSIAWNATDRTTSDNGIILAQFATPEALKKAMYLYLPGGDLELVKMIGNGEVELVMLGNYSHPASGRFPFLAVYNVRLGTFSNFVLFSRMIDPDKPLVAVDIVLEGGRFCILARTEVDYLSGKQDKVVAFEYDGQQIEWAYLYNAVGPIHSEFPHAIAFDPSGRIAIGGIVQTSGDNYHRMMLMDLDPDGMPGKLRKVELLAPNQSFSNRYGWTYLRANGANLHLFSQAVLGGSEPGQLLVTLFDVNYALRTWRNYTMPIRVESGLVDGNTFYFGGQSPASILAERGYVTVKINSANAIVEAIRLHQKGLDLPEGKGSSTVCYERTGSRFWTAVIAEGMPLQNCILIENDIQFQHKCSTPLSSEVFKDTMRISELGLSAKNLDLISTDVVLGQKELSFSVVELCEATDAEQTEESSLQIIFNSASSQIEFHPSSSVVKAEIYGLDGKPVCCLLPNAGHFAHCTNLAGGMYVVRAVDRKGKQTVLKFLVP
ncbi:MAG: hypothetical protein IT266_09070 [Saprospiraceae bacterium]|nr:hypothetical protein [Saprospiraceae bacterium]